MVISVGPPAGLLMASTPSKAAIRRSTPRRPVPRPGVGAAGAVVADADPQRAQRVPQVDLGRLGGRVLGHVGEQLADREVGGRLDRRGRPAVERAGHPGAGGAVEGERADRVGQAAVGQHRRVHAAHQVAQLGQRLGGRVAGLDQQRAGGHRVGVDQPPGGVEREAHRDQPGLGAVVQVALDPAQLGRAGVERLLPGLGQVGHPLLEHPVLRRREHQPGEAAVGAQRPRRGRHPRRQQQRPAQALGPAQVGLPDRVQADVEGHQRAGHRERGRGEQQDRPGDGVHRQPQQVLPGPRVAEQPLHPLPVPLPRAGRPPAGSRSSGDGRYAAAMGTPHQRADSSLVWFASQRTPSSASGRMNRQHARPRSTFGRAWPGWPPLRLSAYR